MSVYAGPRPSRQHIMGKMLAACAIRPHSTPELARLVGSTPESVAVLVHRMRRYGQLRTIDGGTRNARHEATHG